MEYQVLGIVDESRTAEAPIVIIDYPVGTWGPPSVDWAGYDWVLKVCVAAAAEGKALSKIQPIE